MKFMAYNCNPNRTRAERLPPAGEIYNPNPDPGSPAPILRRRPRKSTIQIRRSSAAGRENLQSKSASVVGAARLDSTRLDIRIKSQKHDRNGGGAPSEDPRELRRSPTLKRECAKRGIVHKKKL